MTTDPLNEIAVFLALLLPFTAIGLYAFGRWLWVFMDNDWDFWQKNEIIRVVDVPKPSAPEPPKPLTYTLEDFNRDLSDRSMSVLDFALKWQGKIPKRGGLEGWHIKEGSVTRCLVNPKVLEQLCEDRDAERDARIQLMQASAEAFGALCSWFMAKHLKVRQSNAPISASDFADEVKRAALCERIGEAVEKEIQRQRERRFVRHFSGLIYEDVGSAHCPLSPKDGPIGCGQCAYGILVKDENGVFLQCGKLYVTAYPHAGETWQWLECDRHSGNHGEVNTCPPLGDPSRSYARESERVACGCLIPHNYGKPISYSVPRAL